MNKIEVKILNPWAIDDGVHMAAVAARLTQGGHKIHDMEDFMELYHKPYKEAFITSLCKLPHPTLQKFAVINIAVVGASRRFLAQITRHQNEVKFMSASLQYSDYSGQADFVVPYEFLGTPAETHYLESCAAAMESYEEITANGYDHDSAGYAAPQGLRNIMIISATPYQWKHMISQRTCRRNTDETRYVMLRIWDELMLIAPEMFGPEADCGPFCIHGICREGKMRCGNPLRPWMTPLDIIAEDFPKLLKEETYED